MPSEVESLLERRAQITLWLERLEEQRGTVSERSLERVRADYESRLTEALDALRTHRDAITAEFEAAQQRADAAEARRSSADERLEEGTLRQTIGELSPEGWATERAELEAEVAAAGHDLERAREESERLRGLLQQMDAEAEGDAAPDNARAISEGEAGAEVVAQPAPGASLAPGSPEPAFLLDIDRALDGDANDELTIVPAPLAANDEEPSEETAPKPGLKCPECGYTNDLSAWFCGVCGADVG